ncbi:hypothetical protein [Winogradskyella sp. PE311]|uniref:hypothetical protein n=1 Tax=Winogradskyella sp. PE311 TaxID=3366943 RepID=UPI00397EEA2E
MKINWIIIAVVSAVIGGIITGILTNDFIISIISAILIFLIVIFNNPNRRYIKGFYIVIFPLLSNIYFKATHKSKNFDVEAGFKELDNTTTIVLGLIAIICLVLDYLERKGKLGNHILSIKKNKVGDITGDNNQINQNGL